MILKHSLILISLLLGVIINTVTAYHEYKDETESTQDSSNGEIRHPALLQQKIKNEEPEFKSLNNMDMDMDMETEMKMEAKTEASLKNVRNISDNQLSNEYTPIENEEHHIIEKTDQNTSKQHAEQNIIPILKEEEDSETDTSLSEKSRTARLFTMTTTTIPQYIRRSDEEEPILTQKDINFSLSDYAEDAIDDHLQKHTTKTPFNKKLDNSSEENDEIVPLAMKYYDEIPTENAFPVRRIEEFSSEDYYDDDYHETESTTTIKSTTLHTPDNNIWRSSSPDYITTTTVRTTSPTTSLDSNIHLFGLFEPSLTPTLASLPIPPSQPQTQTFLGITTPRTTSAAASAIPDKKGKQIPIITTVPIVTTTSTTISRRRLLPHEQLRNYIEDAYIRLPFAVIVDPSADSLEKTKTLWNDAMRTNFNIKIVLVTLNESQKSPAAFNFNNTRQFLTGLNSIKEQNSGDAFRGILHAAELVPYDSAVFISTAQLAKRTDKIKGYVIRLLKKRIRIYLIWFGERSLSENETQDSVGGLLGEAAIRSGGEILNIVSGESSQELEGSTLTIVADALRGSQEVDVPVDTTLSSLHVKIDKLMRRAVLETPNGEINLKKLVKFKTLTTFEDENERLDACVPLTKLLKATVFKLKVTPEDSTTEYSVFIRGERRADTFLDDMIKHIETYFIDGHTSYPSRVRSAKYEQSLTNNDGDITIPAHSNIKFPSNANQLRPKSEVETFSTKEIHGNTINTELNNISYSAITTGQPQQRNSNVFFRTNTRIEMGIHSQILIAPGTMGQLYFEVTNTGQEANYYNIQVVDEGRYLIRLTPQSLFLRPGQMTTVTVSVFVPQSTQANTIDHITFSTATSTSTSSLTVNLKVITTIDAQDNISPSMSWAFGGRCDDVSREFDSCSERYWNLYISAQDWQTGIMRLQATPSSGLFYTRPYTVGSIEPLKATYVASCCETKVSLVAVDAAGNQRSYIIDVTDLILTEASIAAIALGSILLVLLIILLVAAIMWCCRRRKIVLDLPTYRSHSTRSME